MPPPPQKRPPGVRERAPACVHPRYRWPSQADRLQLRSLFSSRRIHSFKHGSTVTTQRSTL
eukprot:5029664-Prymnesium_polylepis.1